MSDPNEPKGPPAAPAEGPTQAFRLKLDGWMTDMMKKDLGLEDTPAAEETPPEGAAPAPPPDGPPPAKP